MERLPELGVGLIYFADLDPVIEALQDLVDVIEIEPSNHWLKEKRNGAVQYSLDPKTIFSLKKIKLPKLIHGVGFPLGGTHPPDAFSLPPLLDMVHTFNPPWVSEHLSFNLVSDGKTNFHTGFLLPPVQSRETVETVCKNIREFQSKVPVPVAFENGLNYLKPQRGEMKDGEFIARIAEETDCGIVLDLHNLWCNEVNGREKVRDVLKTIPLDRVWEIHLAGGERFEELWDAPTHLMPQEVEDVALDIIPQLPHLKAIIIEVFPEYIHANKIPMDSIVTQFEKFKNIWERRTIQSHTYKPSGTFFCLEHTEEQVEPTQTEWEQTLTALVLDKPTREPIAESLKQDKGLQIYRKLITGAQKEKLVDCLRYSCRYITLRYGESALLNLMEYFWKDSVPHLFASDEALAFNKFMQDIKPLNDPLLYSLLNYEIAVHQSVFDGKETRVRFPCEPLQLLQNLGAGKLPDRITEGEYEVVVSNKD